MDDVRDDFAMKLGPVASGMKDLAELGPFLADEEREYAEQYLNAPKPNLVSSIRSFDRSVLSKSDLEALHTWFSGFSRRMLAPAAFTKRLDTD
jgi:hypothetical protein